MNNSKRTIELKLGRWKYYEPTMDIIVMCRHHSDIEAFEEIEFNIIPRYLFNTIVTKDINKEGTELAFSKAIDLEKTIENIKKFPVKPFTILEHSEKGYLKTFIDYYFEVVEENGDTLASIDYTKFKEDGIDYENKDNWKDIFNTKDYSNIINGDFQIMFVNFEM